MKRLLSLALFPYLLAAAPDAADGVAKLIRQTGLDPDECYRVRDLRFTRDELKLYFNDGYLIFSKTILGGRHAAVFTAEVEGGDAELLLMPPLGSERQSLALFTHTPNLDEHFKQAAMVFTDDAALELMAEITRAGAKKSPEMGALLADRWRTVMQSFFSSFEIRLVEDLLSPRRAQVGMFYCAAGGSRLGNFDIMFDPRAHEQIAVGQLAYRDERAYFDIWSNFESKSFRNKSRQQARRDFALANFRIQATLEPDLNLRGVTRVTVTPIVTERTLAFDLSRQVHISGVKINGEPGEVFQPDSLRANLLRSTDNILVLVAGEHEFEAGKPVELEFRHEGQVVSQAGNNVFFVGSRGAWYPNRPLEFASYDLTFRYPKSLNLVASGDIVEDRTEGDVRITRRKTAAPIRLAGFNLGVYELETVTRGGYTVEVYGNRRLETALQPKFRPVELTPPTLTFPRMPRRSASDMAMLATPPAPNPLARLQVLASEIAEAFEFMAARFGPPPLKRLTVSPIPGRFGQGFAGLVYLSTLSYLDPNERPASTRGAMQQTFFSEILQSHEAAHQWWGNSVTSSGYADEWLMEALANYSALMWLEKHKGARVVEQVLDSYKTNMLAKNADGRTVESTGPITWGQRLASSQSPTAWRTITYEKGSWILHMLRRRMGDERFHSMLAQLYKQYHYKPVSNEEFRELAKGFLPPRSPDPSLEAFFTQWVYSTGIPTLKFSYSVHGQAPKVRLTGKIEQSEVGDDFSAWVPVDIQPALRGKSTTQWVQTSSEPVTFSVNLTQAPAKVSLDPSGAVLMIRK